MASLASLKREIAIVQKAITPETDSVFNQLELINLAKVTQLLIIQSKLSAKEVLTLEQLAFLNAEEQERLEFNRLCEAGLLVKRSFAEYGFYWVYVDSGLIYGPAGSEHLTSSHLEFYHDVEVKAFLQ